MRHFGGVSVWEYGFYADEKGRWIFNPQTLTLAAFNDDGSLREVYQAHRSVADSKDLSQRQRERINSLRARPRSLRMSIEAIGERIRYLELKSVGLTP